MVGRLFLSPQKAAAGVAGADRVGVSLWCIDDEATAEFMMLMYQKAAAGGQVLLPGLPRGEGGVPQERGL